MKKRLTALALFLSFCLFLSGCATSSAPPPTEAPKASEQTQTSEGGKYDEHVVISTNITDADKMGSDALYDFICETFNMEWDFIPMQFGERHDKARLWVASGDVPDLLWMDLNENLYTEWLQWVKDGTFKPYPDDLSRWPNLQATFDSMIGDDLMRVDGKLYATVAKQDLTEYGYGVPMMFVYRADWAEQIGMRAEDDIYTWDEFWDMVEACIEQDPGRKRGGAHLWRRGAAVVLPGLLWHLADAGQGLRHGGDLLCRHRRGIRLCPGDGKLPHGPEGGDGALPARRHLAGPGAGHEFLSVRGPL